MRRKKKVDLTLKFRCPDRLLAASKSVASPDRGKVKFEEDVVPAFASQYSRSNTLEDQEEGIAPTSAGAAAALFPALDELEILPETPLVVVGGLAVRDVVREVGGIQFGHGPRLEMSHTFWYVGDGATETRFPMWPSSPSSSSRGRATSRWRR